MTIRLVLAPIPENATVYAQKAVDAVKNIEGVRTSKASTWTTRPKVCLS